MDRLPSRFLPKAQEPGIAALIAPCRGSGTARLSKGQVRPRSPLFRSRGFFTLFLSRLRKSHFEAEAVGPHGPYIAARSREWNELALTPRWKVLDSTHEEASEIVKELISDLIKDGWEPLEERGTNWENFRFRRQVK